MNSIAIWYEQKAAPENEPIPELEIHVNHWKLKFKMNFIWKKTRAFFSEILGKKLAIFQFHDSDYFMDIGLKIVSGENVERVCIYLPKETNVDNPKLIEDIGGKLKDPKLLTAVFNEPYTIITNENAKHFTVQKKGTQLFNVYALDITNDIHSDNQFNGTIIKFPFRQFNDLPTYYRIRLKSVFVKQFSDVEVPSNSFLESAYSSNEIIDFRINDKRNLDVSLIEHINSYRNFNISLVHYFVMRRVKDEYVLSNQQLNGVRQLENETWSAYINQEQYNYEKAFAYHLKHKVTEKERDDKKFISDFSAVLKFKFENGRLMWYILGFLAVAIALELSGNLIYDLVKKSWPWLNDLVK
jgi:hypothetical protein